MSHWNPDMRVPKFLLPAPQKIGFLAQKQPNLAKNWHFGPNISIFGPFDLMGDQKTMPTSCLGGFLTEFGPKLAFLVNLGQAMQASLVPCWWVGWWLWRAGCISQDTYLLYQQFNQENNSTANMV